MKRRFEGDNAENRRRRIEAIQKQDVVRGDASIAEELDKIVAIGSYQAGEVLMESGGKDADIHLILCGSVDILIKGQRVATRRAGQHVGEMAMIDPSERRSATVRAVEETVTAIIAEASFTNVAKKYPEIWRRLAVELAKRLRQRSDHVKPVRERPVLFIASSTEGLVIARAIQTACQHEPWVSRVWTDGVFAAGRTPIESLTAQLDQLDFGIVVVTPDDVVQARTKKRVAPRDNVIFELGLLIGALGRDRAFLVQCLDDRELKIPSDLVGVEPLKITGGDAIDLPSRVGPAVTELRGIIQRLGGRMALVG